MLSVNLLPAPLPAFNWLAIIVASIALASRVLFRYSRCTALVAAAVGILTATSSVEYWQMRQLPVEPGAVELTVIGKIVEIPRTFNKMIRIRLKLNHALPGTRPDTGIFPFRNYGTVRLNCYDCELDFRIGQIWNLKTRLRPIHGLANPGGFDFEKWAFQKRLVGVGNILRSSGNQRLNPNSGVSFIDTLRGGFYRFVNTRVEHKPGRAVIHAITLGNRNGIDPSQWKVFSRTGTGHLIAISGLHIGLVFLCCFIVFNGVARLFPALLVHIPAQKLAAIFALPPTVFFAWLSGFSLPTVRAAIMLSVLYLAFILGRRVLGWHSFSVALVLVLIFDPLAPLTGSFWLSFAAVGAIIFYSLHRNPGRHHLNLKGNPAKHRLVKKLALGTIGWFGVQASVSAVVIPLGALFFGIIALLSPFINLLAIPYFSFLVVPPVLFGTFAWLAGYETISASVLSFASLTIEWLRWLLQYVSMWPLAAFEVDQITLLRWFAFAVVLLSLAGRNIKPRIGVTGLCLLLGSVNVEPLSQDEFQLAVLDVGQGLAVTVKTRNHFLVYDTGTRFGESYDMGEMVVKPYLRRRQVKKVDTIMISHGDRDHAGGYQTVANAHPPSVLYSSELDNPQGALPCVSGLKWTWDGVLFEVLSPNSVSRTKHNNRSCVLRISSRYGSALLPGDIEKAAEHRLLRSKPGLLDVDILVVPHHGSRTSSTRTFLNTVSPGISILSRGYSNPFNHPHPLVRQRLEAASRYVLDTSASGAIEISFTEKNICASLFRDRHFGFWSRQTEQVSGRRITSGSLNEAPSLLNSRSCSFSLVVRE